MKSELLTKFKYLKNCSVLVSVFLVLVLFYTKLTSMGGVWFQLIGGQKQRMIQFMGGLNKG